MWSKTVEKSISFWQKEKNCVIALSQMGAATIMDVLFMDGRIEKNIQLGSREASGDYICVQMSKYFKGAAR